MGEAMEYQAPHNELRQIYGAFAGCCEGLLDHHGPGPELETVHQIRDGVRHDLLAFIDRGPPVDYAGAVGKPYATSLSDDKKLELALRLFDRLLGVASDMHEKDHVYVIARQVVDWLDF